MGENESKVLELITNPDFKKWVTNPDSESNLFWETWKAQNPQHLTDLKAAREMIQKLKFQEQKLDVEGEQEILSNIFKGNYSGYKKRPAHKIFHYNWRPLAIAASVSLIFIFSYFFLDSTEEKPASPVNVVENIVKVNPAGIKTHIFLPDGSKVILNAESSLEYPPDFNAGRHVKLSGEAFFDIKHNSEKPFKIFTENLTTEVLGTSFNINAYDQKETEVALVTGKVKVVSTIAPDTATHLVAGQKLTYQKENDLIWISEYDKLLETGWKDGFLILENADLITFITTMERWFGVTFSLFGEPSSCWNIDGIFENESLEEILKGLSFTHQVDYDIKGKEVKLIFN